MLPSTQKQEKSCWTGISNSCLYGDLYLNNDIILNLPLVPSIKSFLLPKTTLPLSTGLITMLFLFLRFLFSGIFFLNFIYGVGFSFTCIVEKIHGLEFPCWRYPEWFSGIIVKWTRFLWTSRSLDRIMWFGYPSFKWMCSLKCSPKIFTVKNISTVKVVN